MKMTTSLVETLLPVRVSTPASEAKDQPGSLTAIDASDDGFKPTDKFTDAA